MIRVGFFVGISNLTKKNPDPRDIPKVKNPDKISNSGDKNSLDVVRSLSSWAPPLRDISGICRKNKSRSTRFWDCRDFWLGIFSEFSEDTQIPIPNPIPGISEFLGFCTRGFVEIF